LSSKFASPGDDAQRAHAGARCDLAVGRIGAPHGVRGQVRVEPLTDYPERFARLGEVCLELSDGRRRRAVVEGGSPGARGRVVLKFKGCDDRAAVEDLRGAYVLIPRAEAVELPSGHYFVDDIVGLEVVTTSGERLGAVREVIRTGANDVYVTDRGMVPATREVVRRIDLAAGAMVVELPEEI